ncbi:hypothetical protein HUJ04_002148 [Dendroctonus ponderosae]|uniref:ubiquitinyl hydrolase 1 n=1 Tax=Dendroctonus ponderosae TaxID=77166 RepID=A0AAR5Q0C3_DENPD|nr:hypothetical protein HUJ04_002148 [Dendroctonus ponderosae]
MQHVAELHIATNLEDLKDIAYPKKLGNNSKALEKAIKSLYREINRAILDQEKCYIYCMRYLRSIETLCKIGDAKYYKLIYASEVNKVNNKIDELQTVLGRRYEAQQARQLKRAIHKTLETSPRVASSPEVKPQLFPNEFISVKELFQAIQDNLNILIVDIRPGDEYSQSKVKFENIINVSDEIIVAGLSANALGKKLLDDTQKIWDKRDRFDALVFVDWNSSTDNITCAKMKYLIDSVVEWDCLRTYKQHPVILNGGFKDFLDSYPGSVTNVHVNFIRNNEDIDELLELDSITYPEPDQNVSLMPLKQFTIEELEDSSSIETQSDEDMAAEQPPSTTSLDSETSVVAPKGGGASTEKKLDNFLEEPMDNIKNKIEAHRRKLLLEARNNKNRIQSDNRERFIGDSDDDKVWMEAKRYPPPIRRETKPKKIEFVFSGWCGLVNIKNTCYMNTILQCLKCIPVIRSFVHSNYTKFITRRPVQVINEFASVIRVLCEGTETNKKVYKPSAFYDTICKLDSLYKKGNHEDCMEFFLFLFNYLNDDCSYDITKKSVMIEREKAWYSQLQGRTSLWVDLFYHQFKCTKICQTCHNKADSYETDNTLMLPVPYRPGLKSVKLGNLIDEYLEDNQILDYKCSKCQNLGVINKKQVVVAPEILVLVLKRYYQDEYQESRKNNACVDFDFNFTFGNYRYTLYSIAEHRGTMDHGHYFAHGVLDDSTFVEFNDERTMRYTGDMENIRGSACAFFYCKSKA